MTSGNPRPGEHRPVRTSRAAEAGRLAPVVFTIPTFAGSPGSYVSQRGRPYRRKTQVTAAESDHQPRREPARIGLDTFQVPVFPRWGRATDVQHATANALACRAVMIIALDGFQPLSSTYAHDGS